ncbi:MAG: xylulokinase [Spirochaetota bacterium]
MILTVDVGTTKIKAGIFSESGQLLECASSDGHQPSHTDCVETDPAGWIIGIQEILSQCTHAGQCSAVTVTGNGPTLVPVFEAPKLSEGTLKVPAGKARLWLDQRAHAEAQQVSAVMGNYVDASFFIPKALHYAKHDPKAYEQTIHLLFSNDFIDFALTGKAKNVFPSKGFERWYWNDQVLTELGLDTEKFPEFMAPGDYVGSVTREAAAYFSLPEGIPVFAGAPDFYASILGTGATSPGRVCNRSGTSEGINLCSETFEGDSRLMCYHHPVEPYYNISGIISTSGKAIGWVRELFGLQKQPFPAFYQLIEQSAPGAGGLVFLPYLAGERAPIWDSRARGLLNGLNLNTSRNDVLRAVAEGVCYSIRDVIEVMEELGHCVGEFRITGGPAESCVLNQLKADITGRTVIIPKVGEAELVGCLIIAMKGLERYRSFADAAEALVTIEKEYTPDERYSSMYEHLFGSYRRTYQQLKQEFQYLHDALKH